MILYHNKGRVASCQGIRKLVRDKPHVRKDGMYARSKKSHSKTNHKEVNRERVNG